MRGLCFSTYHEELRKSLNGGPTAKHALTLALFGFITNSLDKPVHMAAARTTELLKNEANAPIWAVEALNRSSIVNLAETHFENEIVCYIATDLEDDLIANLQLLIETDTSISDEKRRRLLSAASPEQLAEFLSQVFIYVVHKSNKIGDDRHYPSSKKGSLIEQDIDILRRAKEKSDATPKCNRQAERGHFWQK